MMAMIMMDKDHQSFMKMLLQKPEYTRVIHRQNCFPEKAKSSVSRTQMEIPIKVPIFAAAWR